VWDPGVASFAIPGFFVRKERNENGSDHEKALRSQDFIVRELPDNS
jgi:hypothetical protein